MNRDDIIRMAQEAGIDAESDTLCRYEGWVEPLERFAALVAAAEREILANWMRQHGFSTGQAYTTDSLLDRLGTEMVENVDAAVLAEREACAKVLDEWKKHNWTFEDCAAAIRARGDR